MEDKDAHNVLFAFEVIFKLVLLAACAGVLIGAAWYLRRWFFRTDRNDFSAVPCPDEVEPKQTPHSPLSVSLPLDPGYYYFDGQSILRKCTQLPKMEKSPGQSSLQPEPVLLATASAPSDPHYYEYHVDYVQRM